jgi:hypothetical protein
VRSGTPGKKLIYKDKLEIGGEIKGLIKLIIKVAVCKFLHPKSKLI